MAVIKKSQILQAYNISQSTLLEESAEKIWASKSLRTEFSSFDYTKRYDIFLSHSYDDARIVKQIRTLLTKNGYSVYVDWLEDNHLDRGKVTELTATVLKNRMNNCSSLIYLTSLSASKSVWMPWELGYMDGKTGRVAVAPILEDDEDFEGREYLGIYPYLDITADSLFIQKNKDTWVGLTGWMKGENPSKRT